MLGTMHAVQLLCILSIFYLYVNAIDECIDFGEWTTAISSGQKGYASLLCTDTVNENIDIVGGGSGSNDNKVWTYNVTNNHIYQKGTVSTALLLWYPNFAAGYGNYF